MHIPTVGRKTEEKWWRLGVTTWDLLEEEIDLLVKSPARRSLILGALALSRENSKTPLYFQKRLPTKERWRLFGDYSHLARYLDIETNGIIGGPTEVTVVGVFDGTRYEPFINGRGIERFQDALVGGKLIVTFNGSLFDLPILARSFPGFDPFQYAHLDLRFIMAGLGLSGGLKAVEECLGIARPSDVRGMDGFDAVRLWHRHLAGDEAALAKLVAYNREDVVNLESLMKKAFELHRSLLPLPLGDLP